MPLNAIEKLLHESMGLHSSTVGSNTVRQAVNVRMRACDIQILDDYLAVISKSQTELSALIEAVVIPETWFFRDHYPFIALTNWATEHKQTFSLNSPLRILSLPCASGEEPYTLAMCLADCNIDLNHAQIDAVDISQKNLDKAHKAEYGSNSFRGADLLYRDRYFGSVGDHYQLKPEITKRVHFERGNLLDEAFIAGRMQYQVIFCRNLLIYFDRSTQQLAIDRLCQLLAPNGLLFVGHSETCLMRDRPFSPLEYPRCFGFRQGATRMPDTDEIAAPSPVRPQAAKRSPMKPEPTPIRPFAEPSHPQQTMCPKSATDGRNRIQKAFQLANDGHLDEAASICETLLKQREHQADAYYLLGLVRESAGSREEAEQLFRKTVYLDPGHYEALTHLSVIADRCGDAQQAQRFKDRAARAQSASGSRQVKR